MTMIFWLIASALTVLVVGFLVWPLMQRTGSSSTGDLETKLAVYRQQFAELEQDLKNQILTEEQYQQAKRDLERRILEEAGSTSEASAVVPRPISNKVIALVLALVIPTVSGVLYWKLGNQAAITQGPTGTMFVTEAETHQATGGLDALADRLKQRLEQNPNDGVGWALLARSYVELGRHAEAVSIYEKAMKLIPDDAQLLADYADALGVLQGRKLDGKPDMLIRQALQIDPNNVKALMLAGTVAFNRKEFTSAATYWEQARTNLPTGADAEVMRELTAGIDEARSLAGGGTGIVAAAASPSSAAPSNKPALAISGTVKLASSVAGKGSPSDTLFVFARAVDGPPMPVAIMRATKKDLPFSFRLDDSNSPMPARKLSEAGTVVIVARLSKSGEAMPKSGDLQGMSQPVKPGAVGVSVMIDREIP